MGTTENQDYIIKADPGWFVASCFYDDDGIGEVRYEEVIAWKITSLGNRTSRHSDYEGFMVSPLILDGNPEACSNRLWAVKSPSGTFDFVGDRIVENEVGFLEVCKEYWDVMKPTEKNK